jgi:hypothetical protein
VSGVLAYAVRSGAAPATATASGGGGTDDASVSFADTEGWCTHHAPLLCRCLERFVRRRLLGGLPRSALEPLLELPELSHGSALLRAPAARFSLAVSGLLLRLHQAQHQLQQDRRDAAGPVGLAGAAGLVPPAAGGRKGMAGGYGCGSGSSGAGGGGSAGAGAGAGGGGSGGAAPAGGPRLQRLFASWEDGLSFNRLLQGLLGYGGPTLILVSTGASAITGGGGGGSGGGGGGGSGGDGGGGGSVVGAFADTLWREGGGFFGGSQCALLQLQPRWRVCRSKPAPLGGGSRARPPGHELGGGGGASAGGPTNFQYLHSAAGFSSMRAGLGMGGSLEQPRFFLDAELEDCCARSSCLAFEQGLLLPPATSPGGGGPGGGSAYSSGGGAQSSSRGGGGSAGAAPGHFDPIEIEVWGCGGEEALDKLAQARLDKAEQVRRARKVDRSQFVDHLQQFGSTTFAHRDQQEKRS